MDLSRETIIITSFGLLNLILVLLSPQKDSTTYLTIILGSLIVIISQLNDKLYPQTFQNMRIIDLLTLFGIGLQILGMFTSKFLAPFHITIIPFSYYALISLNITVQFYYTIFILRSDKN